MRRYILLWRVSHWVATRSLYFIAFVFALTLGRSTYSILREVVRRARAEERREDWLAKAKPLDSGDEVA